MSYDLEYTFYKKQIMAAKVLNMIYVLKTYSTKCNENSHVASISRKNYHVVHNRN